MIQNKEFSVVAWKEIASFFPESDSTEQDFESITKSINCLLEDKLIAFDQEKRKHRYLKNLQTIKRHLLKVSECMQIYIDPSDGAEKFLPTNDTQDIGLTFDDWLFVESLINKLEGSKPISTMKALNKSLYNEFFYELHSVLRHIDPNLSWCSRGEPSKFEEIVHFILKKMNISVVPDKESKLTEGDITEETIKAYIKFSKKVYEVHREQTIVFIGKKKR